MDVRYADEVRDDLLLSMAWLDERRDGLGEQLMGLFVGGRDESRLQSRG